MWRRSWRTWRTRTALSAARSTAGAGRFARLFIASTDGVVLPDDASVEDIADHWDAINDESGYSVPRNLNEWSAAFLRHLGE